MPKIVLTISVEQDIAVRASEAADSENRSRSNWWENAAMKALSRDETPSSCASVTRTPNNDH